MISRIAAYAVLLPLLFAAPTARALRGPEPLKAALDEADQEALDQVARAPEETRQLVLEAALYPDTLVEMQLLQARSSAAFQQRIEALPQEDQKAIWEVVRVPGLLAELARAKSSPSALKRTADDQPKALRESVLRLGRKYPEVLVELHAIGEDADSRFEDLIADLPEATRDAYRELVDHPDLVTLLSSHVRLSVALGDAYRADPDDTREQLTALSEEVARSDAEAAEDWRTTVSDDPEATQDLEEAAQAYADENGLAYDQLTSANVQTTVYVNVLPYPYWFGFPHWNVYLDYFPWGYWYPVPVHFGFYYRPHHHGFVLFGLPSFSFLYWYDHVWLHRPHRSIHHHYTGRFASYLGRNPRILRAEHLRHHPVWRQPHRENRPIRRASARPSLGFVRGLRPQLPRRLPGPAAIDRERPQRTGPPGGRSVRSGRGTRDRSASNEPRGRDTAAPDRRSEPQGRVDATPRRPDDAAGKPGAGRGGRGARPDRVAPTPTPTTTRNDDVAARGRGKGRARQDAPPARVTPTPPRDDDAARGRDPQRQRPQRATRTGQGGADTAREVRRTPKRRRISRDDAQASPRRRGRPVVPDFDVRQGSRPRPAIRSGPRGFSKTSRRSRARR